MSPVRKNQDSPSFSELAPRPARRWVYAGVLSVGAVFIAAAVAVSALLLVIHEQHRRAAVRDVAAIGYVRSFMTEFTSPDPFHANDYADGVLAHATGKFSEDYQAKLNEVVVSVARSEPTKGEVLDAGVERWNDDGSASVVVVAKTTTTMPDGKAVESGSRWVARAIQEGDQWKISDLAQVI